MEKKKEDEFTMSDDEITDQDPGERTYIVDSRLSDEQAVERIIEYESQVKLTETTPEQRKAAKAVKIENRGFFVTTRDITINVAKSTALGTAKGAVKTVENFDALLGALSYGILAHAWECWRGNNYFDAAIFGLIGVLLVIAKHRLPPGGWISFLRKPVIEMKNDVRRLAVDLYSTISGKH
ncbi:MAG: hypothetical protein DRI56_03185 [Chloroflexota bacterium]|nr:MAG: hypothetical protein DRI56_03185 [Chloroflexota bacterium]